MQYCLLGLAAVHTLFLREHNRLARLMDLDHLEKTGSPLSDEELFQRARKVTIAEWQNIVYAEYLPLILGEFNMRR